MTDLPPPSEPEPCRRPVYCTNCGQPIGYTTRNASHVVELHLFPANYMTSISPGRVETTCNDCGAVNVWYQGLSDLQKLIERVTGVKEGVTG